MIAPTMRESLQSEKPAFGQKSQDPTTKRFLFPGNPHQNTFSFGGRTFAARPSDNPPFGTAVESYTTLKNNASTPANGNLSGQTTFGSKQQDLSFFGAQAPVVGQTPHFGATTQQSGLFGSTPATSSLFGQSTSAFGQAQPQQQNSSFFGAQTSDFGQTPYFGATIQQSGLFGSTPATSSLFGQSTSAFGQAQPQQQNSSFFGATQQATAQQPPFVWTSTPPQTTNAFGNPSGSRLLTSSRRSGTAIPFKVVNGTDTMMKNGSTTNIQTQHQCITCMKEYESQSNEELRVEDYQANRKQGTKGATGAFGAATCTRSTAFGVTTQNKTLFGTTGFNNTAAQPTSTFVQTPTGQPFGATTTPPTSVLGQLAPRSGFAFGPSPAAKPTLGFGEAPIPNTGAQIEPNGFPEGVIGENTRESMLDSTLYKMTEAMCREELLRRDAEKKCKDHEYNISKMMEYLRTIEIAGDSDWMKQSCSVGTQTSDGSLSIQTFEAMLQNMKNSEEIKDLLNQEWPPNTVLKTKTSLNDIIEPEQHRIILADRGNFRDAKILEELSSKDPTLLRLVEPMAAGDEIFRSCKVAAEESSLEEGQKPKSWSLGLALIDSSMDLQKCFEAFKKLIDGLNARGVKKVTAFISHDFSLDIMMKICECCSYGNDLEIVLCAKDRGHMNPMEGVQSEFSERAIHPKY